MKRRMKKIASLFLGAAMTAGLLLGCGSSGKDTQGDSKEEASGSEQAGETAQEGAAASGEAGAADTSEHVDLRMYLIGDRTPDFDEVYGKINEILEEKLNCSISVDFLSWGEMDTKYSLLFSSQEQFDLIFTGSWAQYGQVAPKGGFYELTEEFIQTYAPDIWSVVPDVAWDQTRIDGKIYMVPNYQNEFKQDVMAVRGDLMKEYGIEKITNWDELMDFYKACADHGIYASQGGPWYQFFQYQGYSTTSGAPNSGALILYHAQDPADLDFQYILDWDGFSDYCHQMKELADAGCWSPDVLNDSAERQDGFLNGRTAGMIWNMGSCRTFAKQANAENPDWDATLVDPISNQPKAVQPYINNGVAINAVSEHKERAMMVLNEFYTNPEIFDLAMLGIEGKHWEAVGEDQYKVIDESGYGVDSNCNWGWTNANIKRTEFIEDRTALDDTYDGLMDQWNNNVRAPHVYDGFSFNTDAVSTQFAAVEAALGTYLDPLVNGLVDDVDQSLENLKNALEAAGIRDILKEMNDQAAAYVSEKQ